MLETEFYKITVVKEHLVIKNYDHIRNHLQTLLPRGLSMAFVPLSGTLRHPQAKIS